MENLECKVLEGVGNIVVNVDASGSSVQGDSERSQEFGRALAAAIQSEMIKQKDQEDF